VTRASRSATPVNEGGRMTLDTSGHGSRTPSPSCDPSTWYLKTLRPMSAEVSTSWPATLPRSGMTRRGRLSELPMLAPPTDVNACSSLLPTPLTSMKHGHGGKVNIQTVVVSLLPTPRASDGEKGGPNQRGSSGDPMLPNVVHKLTGDNTPPQSADGRPSSESPRPARTPVDPVEV